MKRQKAENNGHTAGDGGKVKNSDNALPKTPAPAVAAWGEAQRESGSATASASNKRPTDRYRSAAVLEVVMTQRLAEQAFEMCFSDPPAELAALKGSPRLAEPKVLPGRAPVKVGGANESATREPVAKNARIEANDDEA